jgi:glutamyl-tRNA synthetase
MSVRVRFAPSPTGLLTVGGLRSSLFNYLFARHHGGSYILRIEDTDRTRLAPGALEALLEAHRWLGLDWDEGPDVGGSYGPYIQSERLDIYHAAAERLLASGDAYRCFCTAERLDQMRAEQRRNNRPTGYDRRCVKLSAEEIAELRAAGASHVLRFKMPAEGETTLDDPIRGVITWQNRNYDDHVLLKSDGFPTYHLSAIVDDVEMKITHAFRAEEWLSSTPRHLQTYRALGAEPPIYAHLPLILGKDRKKLSKRHGDTSVIAYAEAGYLPDAMFNFLGLIGWSLDDHTVLIPRQQFIDNFTVDRIIRSPALFDLDKLNWLNGEYIRMLTDEQFAEVAQDWLERGLPATVERPIDGAFVRQMAEALKTRVKRMDEVAGLTSYLFIDGPLEYDTELLLGSGKGALTPEAAASLLRMLRDAFTRVETWDEESFKALFLELVASSGVKLGPLLAPLRIAVTGNRVSLPMDTTVALLGRERTLQRIDDALARLMPLLGAGESETDRDTGSDGTRREKPTDAGDAAGDAAS